ncbi:MAG: alpha/beta hydrolase [Pseudomonadota bacterium]
MPSFDSGGVTIDYLDEGDGPLIVLIHGFASNRNVNWVGTGWVDILTKSGLRVVALDNRGHGKSEKLYEPQAYRSHIMAGDVLALMDHLGAEHAALFGYSMGARIATFATLSAPERVSALILSGLAANLVKGVGGGAMVVEALEADDVSTVTDPEARKFRVFADQTKSDRRALAACMRASRELVSEEDAGTITVPTLIVAGGDDEIAGSVDWLTERIPQSEGVVLAGRDHMTAVGDKTHKAEVLRFLTDHGV